METTAELPTAHRKHAADPPDPPRKPQHHKIKIVLEGESASEKGENAAQEREYAHTKAKTGSGKVKYTVANAKYAGPEESISDIDMHVGDTVTYWTDVVGAEVRIVFPECSPFRDDHVKGTEVLGNQALTLLTPGDLESRCYLKLEDGRILGWSPDYPDAGGDNHVRRP